MSPARRLVPVLVLAAALGAFGCSGGDQDAPAPAASAPAPGGPPPGAGAPAQGLATASDAGARLRGVVILTAEAPRVVPCGDPAHVELVDRTGEDLSKAYEALASEQTGEMWVELSGRREGERFVATALLRALPVGGADPCAGLPGPGEVRAAGNEPFWALSAGPAGLTWQEPGAEPLAFPPASAEVVGPARRWATTSEGPPARRLELTVTPERCKDSMSGAWLPLRAEVRLDDRVVSGCAWDG